MERSTSFSTLWKPTIRPNASGKRPGFKCRGRKFRASLLDTTVTGAIREGEAFLAGFGIPSPRLDAEVLLAFALQTRRDVLPARFQDDVETKMLERYRHLLALRGERRVPIQYITGVQEFCSLEFEVDRRVLIPRPETELLVEELLAFRGRERQAGRPLELIADVGTGSGCVAVAAAVFAPEVRIVAIHISEPALRLAASNAARHSVSGRVRGVAGDLLQSLRVSRRLDAVLCNPPYVSEGELAGLQAEVRTHEPLGALVSGPSGLEAYRALIPQAAERLREGGLLALELAADRHEPVREMLGGGLWSEVFFREDFQGFPRVLSARRSGKGDPC